MTKRTYNSIDVAKLVSAFFVAAIHANPFSGFSSTIAISLFARMAVPFFFMVSAFFFFRAGCDEEKLTAYLKRLGRLYLIWFIVGLPVIIKRSFLDHEGGFGADLLVLIRNFFLGSTFRGSWFVMALMIAIPLVYAISKRLSTRWAIGIGALCYLPVTLLSNYHNYLPAGVQQFHDWTVATFGPIQFTFLAAIVFCSTLTAAAPAPPTPLLLRFADAASAVVMIFVLPFAFVSSATLPSPLVAAFFSAFSRYVSPAGSSPSSAISLSKDLLRSSAS